jgi:AMP nucleosidase
MPAKKAAKKLSRKRKQKETSKPALQQSDVLSPKLGLRDTNKKSISEKIDQLVRSRVRQEVIDTKLNLMGETVYGNEAKRKIAEDMLERYTGHQVDEFAKQIILTNFPYYVERFKSLLPDAKITHGSAFTAATSVSANISIIEFGVGSAVAALVGELLGVVHPRAAIFLGLCGAVHNSLEVGDFILPIAAIRGEGVSMHFLPPQVPALPTFKVQKFVSQILVENGYEYRTGSVHTTDFRFWEFSKSFIDVLISEKVLAVEMETASLFTACFASKVNIGALLLVSDCPLREGGIKTKESAKEVFTKFTDVHIDLGIKAMATIAERGETVRHYQW